MFSKFIKTMLRRLIDVTPVLVISGAVFMNCNMLGITGEEEDDNSLLALGLVALMPTNQTINFSAVDSAGSAFSCASTFNVSTLAGGSATSTPLDLRFYISEVSLIAFDGSLVSTTVQSDNVFQGNGAALIDFETSSNNCTGALAGNSTQTNTQLNVQTTALAASQGYKGIQFTLGLPHSLNSLDNSTESSPFNLTSMYWSWTSGYKFFKFEFDNGANRVNFHLGSTGCTGISTAECTNKNAASVKVTSDAGFNLETDSIQLDLGSLLSSLNIGSAQTCMPLQAGANCQQLFTNLGINSTSGGRDPGNRSFFG